MYVEEKQTFIYFILADDVELHNSQSTKESCTSNKELCKSITHGQDKRVCTREQKHMS